MAHLRLPKPEAENANVLSYENCRGDRYYLHEGKTKTGKPRYFFARDIRDGALAAMPDGFEVAESINGVVSIRRNKAGEASIPPGDLALVEAAIGRYRNLRWYKARAVGSAIQVFEPHPRPEELRSLSGHFILPRRAAGYVEERMQKAQYTPVMKFEREGDRYVAYRMTYRGRGGWSWPLATGRLQDLVKKFLPSVGTEKFFDLM